MLGYCLGAPTISYGNLVDPVGVYDEHGAMAGDVILAINTRVVKLDHEAHSFEGNLLKLQAGPSLKAKMNYQIICKRKDLLTEIRCKGWR